MVKYKLWYFNFAGRAEFIRLIFAYAGQEYEDFRFENSEWPEVKKISPLGKAPFLEVIDGDEKMVIGQSTTIARYLARKFNLQGANEAERVQVEMFGDQLSDLLNELGRANREKDDERRMRMLNRIMNGTLPETFEAINRKIGESSSGFMFSSGLTWVDLYLVAIIEVLKAYAEVVFENYKNLRTHFEKVRSLPSIAAWIAKRPKDGNILKSRL